MSSASKRPVARSTPEPTKVYKGKCPICGEPGDYEFRPFCSRRCADIDLYKWLSGSYAIPGRADTEEDGDAGPATPAPGAPSRESDDADG